MRYSKQKQTRKREMASKKGKNEHDIFLNSKRKKYNLGCNYKSSESKKTEGKSIYEKIQLDNRKCLHKRDVAKIKRIVEQKRAAQNRKK